MKIRIMQPDDVPALVHMGQMEPGFQVDETSGFWSETQLRSWIASNNDVLLVAEENGAVIGFVLTAHHRPTGTVIWHNQFVLPEYRDQGVARLLTEELLERLTEAGARYVSFLVSTENEAALSVYTVLGFTPGHKFRWFGKFL